MSATARIKVVAVLILLVVTAWTLWLAYALIKGSLPSPVDLAFAVLRVCVYAAAGTGLLLRKRWSWYLSLAALALLAVPNLLGFIWLLVLFISDIVANGANGSIFSYSLGVLWYGLLSALPIGSIYLLAGRKVRADLLHGGDAGRAEQALQLDAPKLAHNGNG